MSTTEFFKCNIFNFDLNINCLCSTFLKQTGVPKYVCVFMKGTNVCMHASVTRPVYACRGYKCLCMKGTNVCMHGKGTNMCMHVGYQYMYT